jgi:hypothetical protein
MIAYLKNIISWTHRNKETPRLVRELDIINPKWREQSPKNSDEYLELLKEIYTLGLKPGELSKFLKK